MDLGASTPEELETLLEDALVVRDRRVLAGLFEDAAVLVGTDRQPTRGGGEIAALALATWDGDRTYVADPRRIVQARDLALIVAAAAIHVVRRGGDGAWRFAIVCLSDDSNPGREEQ